jgi:Ca2+-binding EF-hand superfamily protein
MNLLAEEQECITEAFQYYDNTGDGKISVGQVNSGVIYWILKKVLLF